MGWFDTILNIGSTIGKVCGALQGGGNAAVHFGRPGRINNTMGGLVFYYDPTVAGSPLTAANQSDNELPITLTFLDNPIVGNLAQEITIPYFHKIPIGPAFQTASNGGNESFSATFTQASSGQDFSVNAASNGITVRAASNTLLVPGNTIQVGSYYTAGLSGNTLTIGVLGAFTMQNVLQVNIQAPGGNNVQITGASNGSSNPVSPVTITVPMGVDVSDGISYIAIVGNISTGSGSSSLNLNYEFRQTALDDTDIAHIKKLVTVV